MYDGFKQGYVGNQYFMPQNFMFYNQDENQKDNYKLKKEKNEVRIKESSEN